jgi:hypothetical protein
MEFKATLMKKLEIIYRFKFPDNTEWIYPVYLDGTTLEIIGEYEEVLPQWAELDCHKCSHCPLSSRDTPFCPLAARLVPIVSEFQNIISYEDIRLEVTTQERIITQKTTAQRSLSSLMGILIACSGCPYTGFFRPMARFHLPLAEELETIYRSTSMYLLGQYFKHLETGEGRLALDGLEVIYENMQQINICLVKRIRLASKADSTINAIILLDTYALAIPIFLDKSMQDIRHFFSSFLDDNLP